MTKRRDFLVGIVFLTAIIAVGYMTVVIKGLSYLTGHKYPLRVRFEEILGLEEGEEVRAKGVKIGQVTGIEYQADGVVAVDLVLFDDPRLHTDYSFEIRAKSPLGGKYVAITPGGEGEPIPPESYGATIFDGKKPSDIFLEIAELLDNKQESIEELIENITIASRGLRDDRGMIGALLHDAKLKEKVVTGLRDVAESVTRDAPEERRGLLHAVIHDSHLAGDVRTIVLDLRTALTSSDTLIGVLLNDADAGKDVKETLAILADKARDLNKGETTIGRLFSEDTLYTEAVDAFKSIGQITEGPGALPWLIADPESVTVVRDDIFVPLSKLATSLNSEQSTIGRLIRNPDLYDKAYGLLVDLRESVEDARENAPINQLVNLLGAVY